MTWLQIFTTLFDVLWLSSVLILLWLIWRTSTRHIHRMESTLLNVAIRNAESANLAAESAHKAVDATQSLVTSVHALIAIRQAEQKEPRQ